MAVGFKGGRRGGNGGFLNDTTVTINSITFKTGNWSGETKSGSKSQTYTGVVNVTPDGGAPVDQYLDAGFMYGDNKISKDGRTIEGTDLYTLDPEQPFGRFIFSMTKDDSGRESGGFLPDELLGDGRNYDAVAGTRAVLARVQDKEGTLARGTAILKKKGIKNPTEEQALEAGKRKVTKGKSAGKSYMLDNLLVLDVVAPPSGKKGGKKTTTGKPATSAPAAESTNFTEQADAALTAILGEADDKTLLRDKLSNKFLRYAVKAGIGRAEMEPIRVFLIGDDYLKDAEERELIVLKGEGKATEIVLVG